MAEPLEQPPGPEFSLDLMEQVLKYRDGELSTDEIARLALRIQSDPAARQEFIHAQLHASLLHEIMRWEVYSDPELRMGDIASLPEEGAGSNGRSFSRGQQLLALLGGMALVLAAVGLPWLMNWPMISPAVPVEMSVTARDGKLSRVVLVEVNHARFFERATPALGSSLLLQEDYLLQQGLVRLGFPSGASAIIEGPAMFHVVSEQCLTLGAGTCSVHAPPGAEGFCVETPRGKVVDRGTRFAVTVSDIEETEIHVMEGEADLFPADISRISEASDSGTTNNLHSRGISLHTRQAARITSGGTPDQESVPFDSGLYKHQLPDRIVCYEATKNQEGWAEELVSVSVQRGGRLRTYPIDDLIPIEVTWFHGDARADRTGHLAGGPTRPVRPSDGLEDRKLSTGFMNIGGQMLPLTHDPVMTVAEKNSDDLAESGTPGLGIRFRSPVTNHTGPDVVLFELQSFMQPWSGDSFHVSPVHFREGLKSTTIHQFDLTMHSQESLEVPAFWRHRYLQPVRSLSELASLNSRIDPGPRQIRFRAIAVGIDLSELGYADGEQVTELFIQHAIPEERYVITERISKLDPVLIAGLPPVLADQ